MNMKLEIPESDLLLLVCRQLESLFLPLKPEEKECLRDMIGLTLPRCEHCFLHTRIKRYAEDGVARFNPYHSGQYTVFLYFLANTLFKQAAQEMRSLADRLYFLNKALNGVELYYEVALPSIFMLDHPVGTVIGRAEFQDYFSFSQNCTVGNNWDKYPRVGRRVALLAGSKLIGDCQVGDNVILAANTCVIDTDIPDCSIVFGSSPNLTFKHRSAAFFESYFMTAGGVKPDVG